MLLICSAWQEEVQTLLAQGSRLKEKFTISTLGIGYLEAALQLNKILLDANYSRIIFLGTAGAYSEDLRIEDIVSVSQVALLNLGTIQEDSYVPRDYDLFAGSTLNAEGSRLNVNCLSSLEITKSSTLSKKIIQYHNSNFIEHSAFSFQLPLVENMELYGVAKIAVKHKVPWSALLGVTNYTNANAHQDWKANHERVSEELCKMAESSINIDLAHSPPLY